MLIYQYQVVGIIVEEIDDKTLDIIDVQYYGFTSKKKLEQEHIIYYNNKDFKNELVEHAWDEVIKHDSKI